MMQGSSEGERGEKRRLFAFGAQFMESFICKHIVLRSYTFIKTALNPHPLSSTPQFPTCTGIPTFKKISPVNPIPLPRQLLHLLITTHIPPTQPLPPPPRQQHHCILRQTHPVHQHLASQLVANPLRQLHRHAPRMHRIRSAPPFALDRNVLHEPQHRQLRPHVRQPAHARRDDRLERGREDEGGEAPVGQEGNV